MAILSHFRDQKKYFSQAVRNTLIVLEKYSPPYLRNTADHTYVYGKCPLPTTSTEQSMLSLSVSTLALHIVSALILQLYQEHISGTPLSCQIYRNWMGHILEHQFLFQKERKIRRKVKKVSFDLFPEICSFWQVTNNASFYVAQYLANLSQLDNNLVKFAQLTLPGFISAVNYDKSIFVKKSKFHTMKVKVER